MTGLYVLAIAAAWLALVGMVARTLTARLKSGALRSILIALAFGVLVPLPLVDEIVGMRQFEQLCRDNTKVVVDRAAVAGATVYSEQQTLVVLTGTWIPIVLRQHRYVLSTTGEVVVSFNTLVAQGGKVAQTFGFSEARVPLIFRGSCRPTENVRELFQKLNITAQDRPK